MSDAIRLILWSGGPPLKPRLTGKPHFHDRRKPEV